MANSPKVETTVADSDPIRDSKIFFDGLQNLMANLGTSKDKRAASEFVLSKDLGNAGQRETLTALYRENWVAGKIVDIIPDDMTREWRKFTGDLKPEDKEKLSEEEERLDISGVFNEAHKWGRLFGTSLAVMSIDDGQEPDKPLKIENIKEGGLRFINVVDRGRVNTNEVTPIADPMDKNFGMPEFYRFNDSATIIHHSRVLRFEGVKLPFEEFRRQGYFNDPILARLLDAIINFNTASDSSASMIYESNVDIFKINNLMNMMENPKQVKLLQKRFSLVNTLKSFNNCVLLDANEEHTSKTNTFAGLKDLLEAYEGIIAAGGDIPATRMFGSAASGFMATGEGDLKNYYDMLKSDQNTTYRPRLNYLDLILAKSCGLPDDADLKYEFNSLFQMTPEQEANVRNVNAQTSQIYFDMGLLTEKAIAENLKEEGHYNITDKMLKLYSDELPEQPDPFQALGGFGATESNTTASPSGNPSGTGAQESDLPPENASEEQVDK